jgi:hypothetical protein
VTKAPTGATTRKPKPPEAPKPRFIQANARTPEHRAAFLKALAEFPSVRHAVKEARLSKSTAYQWRAEDAAFAADWDKALAEGLRSLEDLGVERAQHSDTMLIFLLKARCGYRDTIYQRLAGEDGGAIRTQVEIADSGAMNARIRELLAKVRGGSDSAGGGADAA